MLQTIASFKIFIAANIILVGILSKKIDIIKIGYISTLFLK